MKSKNLIVIPVHDQTEILKKNLPLLEDLCQGDESKLYDLLIVDDGSADSIDELLGDNQWIKCVSHEEKIGFGGSFITAYQFARDFEYEIMILLDPDNDEFIHDVAPMMDNLKYGYDIVTCSRILENYNYSKFQERYVEFTAEISNALKDVTDDNLTDPLSGIKAFYVKSLENMDLTEFSHGILLQLWVQSSYFGLNSIEIPSASGESFGRELELEEDLLEVYLAVLETERHLYKKSPLN